jgi:hypothetical protein
LFVRPQKSVTRNRCSRTVATATKHEERQGFVENVTKIIEAISTLVSAVSWPLLVVFLVYYFGKPLKGFIARMAEFSLKASPTGLEASAKIQELKEELRHVEPNISTDIPTKEDALAGTVDRSREERITHRHNIEENNREVYLVHVIEPSRHLGQTFDIFIYLKRHRSNNMADINYAEFFLGRHWKNNIYKIENTGGLIGISISAYGPVLCTCRVVFQDGHEIMLDRYVDFEMAEALKSM